MSESVGLSPNASMLSNMSVASIDPLNKPNNTSMRVLSTPLAEAAANTRSPERSRKTTTAVASPKRVSMSPTKHSPATRTRSILINPPGSNDRHEAYRVRVTLEAPDLQDVTMRKPKTRKAPSSDMDDTSGKPARRRGRPRKSEVEILTEEAKEAGMLDSPRKPDPTPKPRRTRKTTRKSRLSKAAGTDHDANDEETNAGQIDREHDASDVEPGSGSRDGKSDDQDSGDQINGTNDIQQNAAEYELESVVSEPHEEDQNPESPTPSDAAASEDFFNVTGSDNQPGNDITYDATSRLDRSLADSEGFSMVSIDSLRHQKEQAERESTRRYGQIRGTDAKRSTIQPTTGHNKEVTVDQAQQLNVERNLPDKRKRAVGTGDAALQEAIAQDRSNKEDVTPRANLPFLGFGNNSARDLRKSLMIGEHMKADQRPEGNAAQATQDDASPVSGARPIRLPTPSDTATSESQQISQINDESSANLERDSTSAVETMSWRKEPAARFWSYADRQQNSDAMSWRAEPQQAVELRSSTLSSQNAMSWQPANTIAQSSATSRSRLPTASGANGHARESSTNHPRQADNDFDDIWQEEADRSIEDGVTRPRAADGARGRKKTTLNDSLQVQKSRGEKRAREDDTPDLRELLGEDNRPFRSKIPRTWRRTSDHSFLYSDEIDDEGQHPEVSSDQRRAANGVVMDAAKQTSPARPQVPSIFRRMGISPPQHEESSVGGHQMEQTTQPIKGILTSPQKQHSPARPSTTPKEVRFPENPVAEQEMQDEEYYSSSNEDGDSLEIDTDESVGPDVSDNNLAPTQSRVVGKELRSHSIDDQAAPEDEASGSTTPAGVLSKLFVPGKTYTPLFSRSAQPTTAKSDHNIFDKSSSSQMVTSTNLPSKEGVTTNPQPEAKQKSSGESTTAPLLSPSEGGLVAKLMSWWSWVPNASRLWMGSQRQNFPWTSNHWALLKYIIRRVKKGSYPAAFHDKLPSYLSSLIGKTFISHPKCTERCAPDCAKLAEKSGPLAPKYEYTFVERDARIAHCFIVEAKRQGIPLLGHKDEGLADIRKVARVKQDWTFWRDTWTVCNHIFATTVLEESRRPKEV